MQDYEDVVCIDIYKSGIIPSTDIFTVSKNVYLQRNALSALSFVLENVFITVADNS